jgi:hypothetical protein
MIRNIYFAIVISINYVLFFLGWLIFGFPFYFVERSLETIVKLRYNKRIEDIINDRNHVNKSIKSL